MSVLRNKKGLTLLEKIYPVRVSSPTGMTLIEVLIALVITLIVFLGLMQTALLSIEVNTNNLLREEGVMIAEARMRELLNLSFGSGSLIEGTYCETFDGVTDCPCASCTARSSLQRDVRNFFRNYYTLTYVVTDSGLNVKQIAVTVAWENPREPGVPIDHTITTLKRN